MSKEEKLKIEEYCLLNCSKAQMINKYIEALEINEEHQKLNGELREECKQLNVKNLKQENKQLKERIDKAIEVLEKDGDEYQCVDYMSEAWRILKGDSNESN